MVIWALPADVWIDDVWSEVDFCGVFMFFNVIAGPVAVLLDF